MNPLATRGPRSQQAATPPEHPAMMHAKVWQGINAMPAEDIPGRIATSSYVLPVLGGLAANPKVTQKDVIKAAAQAAADGKVPPSDAVQFISGMPADPDALRPWLRNLYAAYLSGSVHLKAAAMRNAGPPTPEAQPAGGMPA